MEKTLREEIVKYLRKNASNCKSIPLEMFIGMLFTLPITAVIAITAKNKPGKNTDSL